MDRLSAVCARLHLYLRLHFEAHLRDQIVCIQLSSSGHVCVPGNYDQAAHANGRESNMSAVVPHQGWHGSQYASGSAKRCGSERPGAERPGAERRDAERCRTLRFREASLESLK